MKPKIKDITIETTYGETILSKIIPISITAQQDIDLVIDELKISASKLNKEKVADMEVLITTEGSSDEELQEAYVTSKVSMELSKSGEDMSEERLKKNITRRREALLKDKTREVLIKEMAKITVDMKNQENLLFAITTLTLWHVLRTPEDLRVHTFKSKEELKDTIDRDTLFALFADRVSEQKTEDEEIKN